MINELALRYGKAFYDLTQEQKASEKVLLEMRALREAFEKNADILEFFTSELIPLEQRVALFEKGLGSKLSPTTVQFVSTLVENGRLNLFSGVAQAFEQFMDDAGGMVRGTVTSAKPINPDERKKIEDQISKTTGKKVILHFEEDPSLVGGMVAQVGGWTFDDSLKSHLTRMSDDLNRRAH